jgi:E3 ubiquitin-protein ligase UBR7
MLRTRPDPRAPTPEPDHDLALTEAAVAPPTSAEAVAAVEGQGESAEADADDAASDASSSGLPPPLITSDDYDAFVCRACVMAIPTLRRLVGTPGAITVVRADPGAPWTRLGNESSQEDAPVAIADASGDASESSTSAGTKRALPTADAEPAAKRARTESGSSSMKPCLAPPVEPLAQAAYATAELDWDAALCTGDVFLTEKFRERWCRCDEARLLPP